MVSQDLVERAARRTGWRVELVAGPVGVIARRMGEGQSARQIARYLQSHWGSDHCAASVEFVRWVIDQIRRNQAHEARQVRGEARRGGVR
jgi:hypothetical protein